MSILVNAKHLESLAANVESAWSKSTAKAAGLDDEMSARIQAALPTAVDALKAADQGDGVMIAPDHKLASLLQSFVAERARAAPAKKLEPLKAGGYEVKFDTNDAGGWVADYLPSWLKGRFNKRSWVAPLETATTIPDDARIALLGDWGSGMYGAPVCAQTILDQRVKPYDVVMHLGDVYYAGTSSEVRDRFLAVWPRVPNAVHRALNSNHEMYSGGEGYFDHTLNDPAFSGQKASSFALQNSRFLLIGMDTAYEDHDLEAEQVAWIERRVAEAGGRKVILFSHHQLFSAYEGQGDDLRAKLAPLLDAQKIFAWYWAHEHRCVFFDQQPGTNLWARCVGHSGYPAFRDRFDYAPARQNSDGSAWYDVHSAKTPAATVLDGPNPFVVGQEKKYAPNGFVSLDLAGDLVHQTVLSPEGTVLMTSTIA